MGKAAERVTRAIEMFGDKPFNVSTTLLPLREQDIERTDEGFRVTYRFIFERDYTEGDVGRFLDGLDARDNEWNKILNGIRYCDCKPEPQEEL